MRSDAMEPRMRLRRLSHMKHTTRTGLSAGLVAGLMLSLAACGAASPDSASDSSPNKATSSPTAPAVPAGEVTGFGMVIDQGEGTSLCLGPIAESYPPQCEGLPLKGWDWAARDDFEDISGVKFATYAVTGTFDGTTMTVTQDPISGALYDPMPDPTAGRATSTRCDVPDGGWVIVNRAKSNANALVRAEKTALALDGYSTHWTDQFSGLEIAVEEETEPDPDPDMGDDGTLNPLKLVLNVQVSGDVDQATQLMRTVWGGALCVSNPLNEPAELDRIVTEVSALPGVIGGYAQNDRVVAEVIYDDGALQDYVDEAFGANTVVVTSSLRSVS